MKKSELKQLIREEISKVLKEDRFYIDKDNPEEKIVITLEKGYTTLYQSHPLSGQKREFVIANEQIPELIAILSKIK